MVKNEEELKEQVHCFVDEQEVPLKECDLEHQSEIAEDFAAEHPTPSKEQSNFIPEGSSVVNIIVKNGSITERVYLTLGGERITIRA